LPSAASSFSDEPPFGLYTAIRPVLDTVLALALLVLLSPVLLLACLLVKLTSRGPVFYTQTRLGLNGRPFTIIKLRTMSHNCEAGSGAVWSSSGDPRITRLGGWLRLTHVDEFPQLINIILGQMSLIGPRPERPEIVARLEADIPDYRERLSVRPGITGLAQVQLPPDVSLDDVRKKLVCDRYYIDHLGFGLDVRIALATGLFLFAVPMAWSRKWLAIPEPLTDKPATPSC
jgi:lipopolysaccharide/colanic/teichoic acid biosynthesis glycosyltransferase